MQKFLGGIFPDTCVCKRRKEVLTLCDATTYWRVYILYVFSTQLLLH